MLQKQTITAFTFAIYLTTVILTPISLTGYWTDVIFSFIFSIFALRTVFSETVARRWLILTQRTVTVICSLVVFGLIGLNLIIPFGWDVFKLRSFYFQAVEGRLFNAYFKPVGAYGRGYGSFWITESPKHFPIFEKRVYRDGATIHNFLVDTVANEPIDNYEIVRTYIKDEVIKKESRE